MCVYKNDDTCKIDVSIITEYFYLKKIMYDVLDNKLFFNYNLQL
jgi:hypothetical protein